MKRLRVALALLVVSGLAALGGVAFSGASDEPETIRFHFSRFEYNDISVRVGEPVTFVLKNEDPIAHEWIVGTEDVHARHRTGTEPYHDEVPTEVTVPALQSRTTTVTFAVPGVYSFVCHLPGHEQYGMKGALTVVGN